MAHFKPLLFAIFIDFIIKDSSLFKSESCIETTSRRLAFYGLIALTLMSFLYTQSIRNSPTSERLFKTLTLNSAAFFALLLALETFNFSLCYLEIDDLITRVLKIFKEVIEVLYRLGIIEFIVKVVIHHAIFLLILNSAFWDRLVAEITNIIVGVQQLSEFMFPTTPTPAPVQDAQQGNGQAQATINLNIRVVH